MKKSINKSNSILTVVGIAAMAIFSSCSTPAEKVETAEQDVTQAQENLSEAKDDYLVEVENFKKESADKITANDKAIAEFRTEMANSKKELKVKYDKQIADLESKNDTMKIRMANYKDEGKDNWQSFKVEFNSDMEELGRSFKDFTVNNKK